jgi:hypothetical protein
MLHLGTPAVLTGQCSSSRQCLQVTTAYMHKCKCVGIRRQKACSTSARPLCSLASAVAAVSACMHCRHKLKVGWNKR